jgi:hypothetical protein
MSFLTLTTTTTTTTALTTLAFSPHPIPFPLPPKTPGRQGHSLWFVRNWVLPWVPDHVLDFVKLRVVGASGGGGGPVEAAEA